MIVAKRRHLNIAKLSQKCHIERLDVIFIYF